MGFNSDHVILPWDKRLSHVLALYVGKLPPPVPRSIHIVYGKQKDKSDVMSRQNANDHVPKTFWEPECFSASARQKEKTPNTTQTHTITRKHKHYCRHCFGNKQALSFSIVVLMSAAFAELIWISSNPECFGWTVWCGEWEGRGWFIEGSLRGALGSVWLPTSLPPCPCTSLLAPACPKPATLLVPPKISHCLSFKNAWSAFSSLFSLSFSASLLLFCLYSLLIADMYAGNIPCFIECSFG